LPGGGRALYRAREEQRDQSYFLFATTREQLDVLRFPLGDKTKAETRELARAYGLSIADKPDSQDICFVPSGRYTEVIEKLMPGVAQPGDIVDQAGRVLGRHNGIIHFTVGQRRGLGIAGPAPLYVIHLDAARNRIVVGPREALRTTRMRLREVNWIGDDVPAIVAAAPREVYVKVRSTRPPQPAWLRLGAGGAEVDLVDGEDGVSPGQACVFYDAEAGQARVLGGGFIASAAGAEVRLPEPALAADGTSAVRG
jgi:tRNA-specific 2-thiouridylase